MPDIPLDTTGDDDAPRARAGVRFTGVAIKPYPDGRRMKLSLGLTPFQQRPSVEMVVTNAAGQDVAALSLIEAMDTRFDLTVHLRGPEPRGPHTLRLTLYYRASDEPEAERQVVDEHTLTFVPAPEAGT
ncbi:MAG: hypothetical protein IT318_04330 [Anaerolineales bacterium]|nr:hypothetical protein [Anaerolineales bacterium]